MGTSEQQKGLAVWSCSQSPNDKIQQACVLELFPHLLNRISCFSPSLQRPSGAAKPVCWVLEWADRMAAAAWTLLASLRGTFCCRHDGSSFYICVSLMNSSFVAACLVYTLFKRLYRLKNSASLYIHNSCSLLKTDCAFWLTLNRKKVKSGWLVVVLAPKMSISTPLAVSGQPYCCVLKSHMAWARRVQPQVLGCGLFVSSFVVWS